MFHHVTANTFVQGQRVKANSADCAILLKFVTTVHCESVEILNLKTIGSTGGLKWQCIANCHLFSLRHVDERESEL